MLPTLAAHLSRRRWRPTTQTIDPPAAALVVLLSKEKIPKKIFKRNTRQIKQTAGVACAAAAQQQKVEFCCNALATPHTSALATAAARRVDCVL